ncbi:pleckstrin homology domain-containing family G member 5 isoform X2 [Mastacembelus armatus]|uniref:pleckstrin homology domain-containing family G member 5 isoform X2 n=1 Tax=Mastacembelus armatus TaxID=205130 RepID=UPI000E459F19|nr:pleckstrin homology domain-containing family G member 6 isoform X2 [Mastacembelus armatus]
MDPTKLSPSSKAPHNESPMEEGVSWVDSVDGDRPRDTDDLKPAAAETNHLRRGSADKHRDTKFNTLSNQRWKSVSDFVTLSKGTSAGAKSRPQINFLFNQGASDKNPPSEEQGQLDVLKQSLERFPVPLILKWRWKEESQGTTLEKTWTDIVHSHSTMTKMQRHQQEALWEFVNTELTYINKLLIIKDVVIAALVNLHQHGFLQEVTPELLFSNLPSILSAHQLFWQEVIYPMLVEVRRTGKPLDPTRLETGCLQFHERFSSYKHYCSEEENNLEFTRRQTESSLHFLTFVQWVESHPQCDRMRLGDMQVKPHQRITKYPLLLKAVLKNTGDPHVQRTLKGMLSGVNNFLKSINDYLKLKDEQLALSITAQKVEGYVMEGINEEIDKHVREICQFDLTCPIRGVGPGAVRKLLLNENLKIRGRKDSKLEVMALLFSDVLLMTKLQKKGERLKVVRPPLALDRTTCIALKDGCSFVLVEIGELQSAMNVYIFAASTSESCSTWISTINQAKETLSHLRETERNRQLENWKIQQQVDKPVQEAKLDDLETEEQPLIQSGEEASVDDAGEFLIHQEQWQASEDVATGLPFWYSHSNDMSPKPMHKKFSHRQNAVRGYEWIEMGVREDQVWRQMVKEEEIIKSQMTEEQRETFIDRVHSAPNLGNLIPNTSAASLRYSTPGPPIFLPGGLPDVDYPTDEDSDSQFMNQDTRRNSSYSQSGDMEGITKAWGFHRNLKSPGLQRKRIVGAHQGQSVQNPKHFLQGSKGTWAASSNYDTNYNFNNKRNSAPSGQSSDSHRVFTLGSLKSNQNRFWNIHGRVSPDAQTLSESELPDPNCYNRHKKQSHRRASIPNIIFEREHDRRLPPTSLYTLPQEQDPPFPSSGPSLNGHPSPLHGLLERAKERVRERDVIKRDKNGKITNMKSGYPPSPSFSTTPSDTELEKLELLRGGVRKEWNEQLVDGDEDELRNSVVFRGGVNVDWTGWCCDDDEIMDHLQSGDEGLLEGISRSLVYLSLNPEDEWGWSNV